MNKLGSLAALLCVAALGACDENAVQEITGPMPSARVKFYNFSVGAPGVNFYANDTKLTAINSATGEESVNGTNYGSVAAGGYYTAIAPGSYTLSGRIAAATDKDLVISSAATTIEDAKYYTYYQAGFYDAAAKKADVFVVEDPIPTQVDYAVAQVRFVNASPNASPMTLHATLMSGGTETALGGVVAYKSAGAFTAVPEGVYSLSARSDTKTVTRADVSFEGGRVYTISLRGDMTVTSTTATNRPFLDNTANY
ncbi:MAG TPA: DUF4397 domain-containing protein [Gemmatimonadales bacterium]